jgi:hypothetical protein
LRREVEMSEWDDFREGNGINKGELEMIGHAEALANPGVALNVEEPLRPGADLSKVAAQMILWMLVDEKEGITAFDLSDNVKILARELAALYARSLAGEEPRDAEWDSVCSSDLRDLRDLRALVFAGICADQLLLFLRASRSSSAEGELLRRSGSTASPELLPW